MIKKILTFIFSLAIFGSLSVPAFADSITVNFENPPYTVGNINGQDSWTKTGAFDVSVVTNTYGFSSFGLQSLRTSDAVTSGSFGDQTFAKPLTDSVGETASTNGTFSAGTKKSHFEMQFDFASTQATEQTGMHVSASPDRGDGSRMSYLRFDDMSDGIHVFFDDVTDAGPVGTTATFNESDIATISRAPHTIKLTLDTVDGPSNDVVNVYIDGVLKKTGTSWEDYYRFDPEANAEQSPRIVKTVLFRESGTANNADSGKGFLIDNLSLSSSPVLVGPPVHKDDCKNGGWKTFNNPSFKNQDKCLDYVEKHSKDIKGDVKYNAYSLNRHAEFEMNTGDNKGSFEYEDASKNHYKVKVSSVSVNGNFGYFAGVVTKASNPAWVGLWLFAKVEDNSPDKIWGSFTDQTTAINGVANQTYPADGPFSISSGNIKIH